MTRFLVVDPEPAQRAVYRAYFERAFEIDEAPDARVARDLIGARRYHRGLFHQELADGSGLDLLEAMRQRGHGGQVLVVARGFDRHLADRAMALGGVLVVAPVSLATLRVLAHPHKSRSPAGLAREYARVHSLTARQTEILEAVARGTRPSHLPKALGMARGTAKALTRQILRKSRASCLDDVLSDILRAADSASDT